MRQATIGKPLLRAIKSVWGMAVDNSCCCAGTDPADGYLSHEKGCHVHLCRKELEAVAKLIEELDK